MRQKHEIIQQLIAYFHGLKTASTGTPRAIERDSSMTTMTTNNMTNTPAKGRTAKNVLQLNQSQKQALFDEAVKRLGTSSGARIEQDTGLGHGFVQRGLARLKAAAGIPRRTRAQKVQNIPTGSTFNIDISFPPAGPPTVSAIGNMTGPVINTTAAAVPQTIRRTHVAIVLDASGSMAHIRDEALGIADAQLRACREVQAAQDPTAAQRDVFLATAVQFSTTAQTAYVDTPVERRQGAFDHYMCGGGTALWDATRAAIEALKSTSRLGAGGEDAYQVLVVTDGEENSSKRTNARDLTKLIQDCESDGRWTIAFMVPKANHGYAGYNSGKQQLLDAGIPVKNISEWEATRQGAAEAARVVYAAQTSYAESRTRGIVRTQNYFVDAGKLTVDEVRKRLKDVTSQFKRIHVSKEDTITNVVNHAGEVFRKGNTYYELTKDELVQADKTLLIQKRLEKTIYGGSNDDVRTMLGIATEQQVRVKIANLGEWRVYVKSNSDNRVLVRGSDILWGK